MNRLKSALAAAFRATRLDEALLRVQGLTGPYVRAVNYHDVPASHAEAFEDQLRFYAKRFVPVGYRDLLELHAGRWRHDKPGILLSFDDGLRSHSAVVAPLLERHGFVGWFFVPAGLILDDDRRALDGPETPMTWSELRRIAERHVIGCHTMTHRRLSEGLTEPELALEIGDSKRLLERKLGREVSVFCWVGGEEWTYSASAAQAVRREGYRVAFMTNSARIRPGCDLLQLQRTNVEAWLPPSVTRFQLSGFVDLVYTPKRRRVNRLTARPPAEDASPVRGRSL